MKQWDAVVVGSGPNGLAAAVALARKGEQVKVCTMEGAALRATPTSSNSSEAPPDFCARRDDSTK